MSDTDFFDDDLMQRRNSLRSPVRESGSGAHYDEIPVRAVSDLNLTRMARRREEINARAATTVKTLEQLRRRQSDLEREKQALEELSQKQQDYERGKIEMLDHFNHSIVTLEKQASQAARLAEIYTGTRRRFADMLKEIENLKDDVWTDDNFRDELSKAVAVIENARKEYNTAMATVEATGGERLPGLEAGLTTPAAKAQQPGQFGFGTWLKIGFALVLPLGVLMLVVALVVLMLGHAR